MIFHVVHQTVNLSIVHVIVCYLFMLLLLYMQLHDWLVQSQATFSIVGNLRC